MKIRRLKREAVLKEAGKAFGQRGYHNTSLDDIAEALEVSKGTLYNYVKDKQEILYELHKVTMRIAGEAFEHGKALGGTGAEQLRNILRQHISSFTTELGACAVLVDMDALRDQDRAEIVKQRDVFHKMFVKIIEKGIRDGSIRPVEPSLAVFTFMGAIFWLPKWYSPAGKLRGDEFADAMVDLMMSGLLQTRPSKSVARKSQAAT
ncbi:TetR/AcrR family transcriptional regulator [Bradyrhizobium sp. AUGA SZCCT0431]|uniref:TetR/AcrR family transcriptional regulator n=1 Tax=Bradyrhizobium sp. AUGA SZCCT0431 TaxID=2807674 RepID=UPI001BA7CA16|nr:TetR/AcrR family transcriptional regulator [Bradyrhizobium sp. AUGA SZCCT0431]MBR1146175.1 TetR family transcriptional regulator [Bradyrhizobium sp. AUGA SZCCT0431]